jgi:serine/threonine-protein kinase HipA
VPFSESDAENLALEIIRRQMTITGVQPKLTLELDKKLSAARPARFTIVGL